MALLGLAIVAVVALVAILAPVIAPYDPLAVGRNARFSGPTVEHWFGGDLYGRDILSRIIYGARVSMMVGIIVTLASVIIGGALGLLTGYVGGVIDAVIGRITDVLLAVPGILLAIAIVGTIGSGVFNVCIALALGQIPLMIRVVRGSTIAVRGRPMVTAAVAIGANDLRVLFVHILPFVLGAAAVQGTFVFSHALLSEASLSFLGIGIRPPQPTWGNMISEARAFLTVQPWNAVFPGIAIMILVLGVNLLGDGLRDVVDTEGRAKL
jgi:peptide/nickel transport system permease protein